MIRRGHKFRILTSEAFRPLIERKGVTYIKLDTDADHVMRYLVAEYKTGLDFAKGMLKLKKENSGFMEQTISAIKGSDFVMYGTCVSFAYHAAELLGIPCARVIYSPMDPTRLYSLYSDEYDSDKVLKSYKGLPEGVNLITILTMNRWRRLNGLSGWRIKSNYKELKGRKLLTFYPTSRVMMRPDPTWGKHIHVTGYWYHPEEEKQYQITDDLQSFLDAGEKPVFVAFGKAESKELAELQIRVLQALKETEIRAIVQADHIPESERANTEHVYFAGR